MPRCAARKPDGTPCERIVPAAQSHCYSHDPRRTEERRRNASRGGRARGSGELVDLKKRVKSLVDDVLEGKADRGRAAVANQLYNTLIRAVEQERRMHELGELAERLEALEAVLKGRRAG